MNAAWAISLTAIAALAGCASPSYVDKGAGQSRGPLAFNEVEYQIHDAYRALRPDCVAVLPLTVRSPADPQATAEDAAKVRMSLFAHLSTQSRRTIRPARVDHALSKVKGDRAALGRTLKCAAAIEGEITEYGNAFFGIYSSVTVGAELRMIRLSDGALLWEGRHVASSRDGSVPLDPVGIAMGIFAAVENVRDEQILRVTGDLTRRLVFTIPDDAIAALDDPADVPVNAVEASSSLADAERIFAAGDHAGAIAAAEKVIAADPANKEAWFLKGRVLMLDREFAAAEPAILRAASLDRGDARIFNALGALNAEKGHAERALAAYRMAIESEPANGFAWHNTGILHTQLGNRQDAADAFYGAALAFLKTGDAVRAERALGELRPLAAEGVPVQNELDIIQSALSDLARRTS